MNTSPPEERVIMLKSKHFLENMKENSTDIESSNIVTLYQQRPKVIETLCLADFISMRRNKKAPNHCGDLMEELPETEYEEDNSDDIVDDYADVDLEQTYMFKNGTEIVKRKTQSILRWVHFDVETDSEKYYRELLMLFTH